MPSTLPYYWQLASASTSDRLPSSKSLVETLITQQKAANVEQVAVKSSANLFNDGLQASMPAQVDGKEVEEAEKSLEAHNCTEVVYALRRLMKGLASHRESSRLGFSVALCELIGQLKSVSGRHMIVLILSYSSPTGKVKGQEERDLLFARLFGLYAVIRSGLLSDGKLSDEADFRRVVEVVWMLGRSKTWLRESSGWIIVEAIRLIAKSDAAWKADSFTWLTTKVCDAKEVGPESIAIYATLREVTSSLSSSSTTQILPHLASPILLASSNLTSLARMLKDGAGEDESAQNISSGSSRTQAHFVWDILLQDCIGAEMQRSEKRAPFFEIYKVLVDEALFANSASDQKKSWGFQIFEKALRMVTNDDVPHLFTSNFMRTWMNQLGDKNRMLYKTAQRSVIAIQEVVRGKPEIGFIVISQLVGKHGNSRFDAITGTKTVESILACMNAEGVQCYVEYLIDLVCKSEDSEPDSPRKWALDQLLTVIRNASIPTSDDCVCNILFFLASHGLFSIKSASGNPSATKSSLSILPKTPLSANMKNTCRARFFSCLGEVADRSVNHTSSQGKVKRLQGQMACGQSWISKAFDIVNELEKDVSHFTALYAAPLNGSYAKGQQFSKRLSKASHKAETEDCKNKIDDLQSMLLAGMLYSRKDLTSDPTIESGLIDSLIECSDRLVLGKKGEEGEPSAMELFVHCLVSYFEQPSAFLRSVATQAFTSFSGEVNRAGLEQLLDQLGFHAGGGVADDGEEEEIEYEDEVESDDEDENSDDIMSDSISETSATSKSSTLDGAPDPVLVAKLQEVLKAAGAADSDADSSDEEEEDASEVESIESDFNDDQMLLIDDKLADIFRQRLGSRKAEEEQKKETIALHIKILDLLDVFARKQSSNPLCVDMVLPLFTIALEKDVALSQLKQRASTILTKTLSKSKDGLSGTIGADEVFPAMEAVHKMAATKLPTISLNLCSTVNVYLSKACKEDELLDSSKVKGLYLSTLKDFVERKNSNLKPQFLIDVFQRLPLLGLSLRHELLLAASGPQDSPKQSYRQLQVLEMLRVALVQLGSTSKERDVVLSLLSQVIELILDTVRTEKLRLKEIVKVGLDLGRLAKKVCKDEEELKAIWSPEKINEVIEALGTSNKLPNSASLQNLLRQLLAIVTPPSPLNQQHSASSNGKRKGIEESDDKKKKKKKRGSTTNDTL